MRVALERVGIEGDRLRLALAAQLVRRGLGVRQQHRPLALGIGTDARRGFGTLRPGLARHPLPLGLHARQHRLGVLLRQVGPADAHIHHPHAEAGHLGVHLVTNGAHDGAAARRQHVQQLFAAQHPQQRGRRHRVDAHADAVLGRADRLVVFQRVDDAEAHEAVHPQAPLVAQGRLLGGQLVIQQAAVERDDRLHERDLDVQAWRGDQPHRPAELRHQRLLGLVDGEQRRTGDDDDDHQASEGDNEAASHGTALGAGAGGLLPATVAAGLPAPSGRNGTTPFRFSSTTMEGVWVRMSCIVSI